MGVPTGPCCTEQDLWRVAWRDYEDIVPDYQVLAAGSDGTILAADRWTIQSASNNFVLQGVTPGRFIRMDNLPDPRVSGSSLRDGGIFQVSVVTTNAITVRRPESAGGMPPGPANADLPGIRFLIGYVDPQIAEGSSYVNTQVYADPMGDANDAEWRRQCATWATVALLYKGAWQQTERDLYYLKMRDAERIRDGLVEQFRERRSGRGLFAARTVRTLGPSPLDLHAVRFALTPPAFTGWSWPVGFLP